MAKAVVWDLKAMSEAELRDLVRHAASRERDLKAPNKKARRGWRELKESALAELEARELLTSYPASPRLTKT